MRALIQRVREARVEIGVKISGEINSGLLILLGIEEDDNQEDVDWLCKKISSLRIFNDDEGKMNLDIKDVDGEILVVSQFTLHAKYKKGTRPSFIRAAKPEKAIPLYESFIETLRKSSGLKVESGVFGAMMDVHLVNWGPVTLWMDTKNKE